MKILNIKNEAGEMETEIRIDGEICSNDDADWLSWWGVDCTCPKDVRDAISKLNGKPMIVRINSYGGDVFAASEIYTALIEYDGDVRIIVESFAASAASVIAMGGTLVMSPTAMLMIHNASSCCCGDHREMGHTQEVLKTVDAAIRAAYKRKTGIDDAELTALMDAETWMTAQDALDRGFADEILGAKEGTDPPAEPVIAAVKASIMAGYKASTKIAAISKHPPAQAGIFTPKTPEENPDENLQYANYTSQLCEMKGRIE